MTPPPIADVGPRPTAARASAWRWENTTPYPPHAEPKYLSVGRNPRRLTFTLLGAFAFATLRRARSRRRATPVIHHLVAADELRFTELCQQITHARRGVEQ